MMCFCDFEQEGDEFYRKDFGLMMYVANDGHSEALKVEQSAFFGLRDGSSVAMA